MKKVAILGASGYTGAELIRHLSTHAGVEVTVMTAERAAGKAMGDVFPHLAHLDLPMLVKVTEVDWNAVDFVFCALPHGTTQQIISQIATTRPELPICDLSADFRLRDTATYEAWYGPHTAHELQKKAVYGMTEIYRDQIKGATLVANPGCYTTTAQMPLIPLLKAGLVKSEDIIIDAKSGVTGAGRAPKEGTLFTEVSEGFHAYAIANHRHAPEIDQELSAAAGSDVQVTFTPHLLPQNRGILATIYAKLSANKTVDDLHAHLSETYKCEPFVQVLPLGKTAATRNVRGSNNCQISVHADRVNGRVIICSAIDNLVKGASGQAIQNMNLQLGFEEVQGLSRVAMFP